MQQQPDIQQFNTVEVNPPAAVVAPASGSTGNQDTTHKWKTLTVPGHTTERLMAVKAPAVPSRSLEIEALIDRTSMKYNDLYQEHHNDQMAIRARQVPAPGSKKVIISQNHVYKYGYSGIDQSTLDAFGDLNLNLGSMTAEDKKKVYEHPLMQGEEKRLPLSAAVALLKVKLLDYRADLIDKKGMRPVEYNEIPLPKKASEPMKVPDLSPRNAPTEKLLPQPESAWEQQAARPEKKGWFSRAKSAVGGTFKKLFG